MRESTEIGIKLGETRTELRALQAKPPSDADTDEAKVTRARVRREDRRSG